MRDPLIVQLPSTMALVIGMVRRQDWDNLSARDQGFLKIVLDGEAEYGVGNFGVVAFSGGDASTIRSLERRGLLQYLNLLEDDEGKARRGYTFTERGREAAVAGLRREPAEKPCPMCGTLRSCETCQRRERAKSGAR